MDSKSIPPIGMGDNLCTQSPAKAPTFKETIDMFADHSPASRAQFAAIAAINEDNQINSEELSPEHKKMVQKFRFLDKLTTQHQQHACMELKTKVTEHYIRSTMTSGESSKRILFGSHETTDTKPPPTPTPTCITKKKPLKKCRPIKSKINKKRERSNVKWKLVPEQKFVTVAHAKDYIGRNFPTFRVKSTNLQKHSINYACKKHDKSFGSCRANIHSPINPDTKIVSVLVKVSTDPDCACSTTPSVPKRGLSHVARDKVRSIIQSNPTIQPNQVRLQMVQDTFNTEGNDNEVDMSSRQKLKDQIVRAVSYDRCSGRSNGSLGPVVLQVGQLVALKEKYTFHPPLSAVSSSLSESQIQELGSDYHDSNHLNVVPLSLIKQPRKNAFRMMTYLDPRQMKGDTGLTEPEKNLYDYIDKVRVTKSALEESEGNTYDTTTVITSLAFLWNVCHCKHLDWCITVTSDGTADVVSNDWTLLTMGVHSHSKKGTKQFKPFFYVLAPGERQECFGIGVVSFLKYVRLLFGITNIRFLGGCVCDRSNVFVNIFQIAFPESSLGQCYQHILRKFLPGKGNGHYSTLVFKKSFLRNVALTDIRHLYQCLSKKMFRKYADLVKEAWVQEKETRITKTFFESYINHPLFSTWNVNFSSVAGCTPTNNPIERNNSINAGTKDVDGLMRPGYSISTMLGRELPKMIVMSSADKVGVERHILLHQEAVIFHDQSLIHKELIKYFGRFDTSIDCKNISDENDTGVVTHAVNSDDYLGLPITMERIKTYNNSLEGVTEYTYKDRNLYFDSVHSLCTVSGKQQSDGSWKYCGSCADWYSRTYCVHSAVFQYKDRLKSFGRTLPTTKVRRAHRLDSNSTPKQMLKKRYFQVQALLTDISSRIIVLAEHNEDAVHPEARKKIALFPNLIQRVDIIKSMGKPKVLENIKIVNQSLTMSQDVSDILAVEGSETRNMENMTRVLSLFQTLIPLLKKL
jgi:hypothetical protein